MMLAKGDQRAEGFYIYVSQNVERFEYNSGEIKVDKKIQRELNLIERIIST